MKNLSRIACLFPLLLAACGDDITEQVTVNANVGAVETSKDLPECTKDIAGQTAFVSETHEFLGCDGKEWQLLSASTISVGDNVCTSTSLSDGTGFEIFCNGESIGTVKNGKDGEKGADGKDGAPGEKGDTGEKGDKGDTGAKGDKGDNGTNGTNGTNGKDGADGTGCKIQESTALTATIACGSETFTMDLTGSANASEECDPDDEDCTPMDDVELSGVSQKGPFVSGTDVTAYELENGKSLKQTGKTFGGKIENQDGSFNIRTVKLKSSYAYLVADGFYRNEVTGRNSAATIKLRALTNLDGRSTANINLVTHLEYDRVQRLVTKDNKSVIEAKRAAEKSLFAAFDIDNTGFKGFAEDYNILKEGDGNAALLAVSAMLQGDRDESELTALLASLSVDLGDNGVWDNEQQRTQIADWAMKANLEGRLATIRANVEGWGLSTSKAPAFEGHVTNFWMTELGVPVCTGDSVGRIFATKNTNSAYYAANDSVYTEGDSSLERLICAASGDSYAWRFATDIEKDIAAFGGANEGLAKRGSIDTLNVYVFEDGKWRHGTSLDSRLDASCADANKGMTDSAIVMRDTTWYICDVNDDALALATVPTAWRKATTAEADTAGFGVPAGDDPIVKNGNVNKSHYYVYEDTSGNGNYVWRYGTDLDDDANLGPCTRAKVGNVGTSVKGKWYKCVDDLSTRVEGVAVPTEWREATNYEKDTYGLEGTSGDYQEGKVNKNLYYVKEESYWRPATDMEYSCAEACTENQKGHVKPVGIEWYTCSNDFSTVVDTFKVEYTWRKAQNIEIDTNGLGLYSHSVGDTAWGRGNTSLLYVYENGNWTKSYNQKMDVLVGKGCVDGLNGTYIYGSDGVKYICYVRNESDKNWVVPYGIMVDTLGWAISIWSEGQVRNGRLNPENTYVYEDNKWRYGTALDSIFARFYASEGGSACLQENEGDTTGFKYEDLYYVCTPQSLGDTVRMWVPAPAIYNDTKEMREKCVQYDPDYGHGEFLNGRVNAGRKYVCDRGSFRELSYAEELEGRGCVNYIHYHIYETNNGFKECTPNGWVSAEEKDRGILRDSDGNVYATVVIGTQLWMAENLNRETPDAPISYSLVKDGVRYYNYYVLRENVCPTGWHVPTKAEWQTLIDHTTAAALKSTTGWDGGRNGTNESGFSAYPDGYYYTYGISGLSEKGYSAYFWTSSTKYSDGTGDVYIMRFNYYSGTEFDTKENGPYDYRPVRCILDKWTPPTTD